MVAPSCDGVAEFEKTAMKVCMAWRNLVAAHGGRHSHGAMAGHGGDKYQPKFWVSK